MKRKTIILLGAAMFFICDCAGKQVAAQRAAVKETVKTDGQGIAQDKQDITQTEIYKNYYKAAKKGDAEAQFKIGSEYAYFYGDYFNTKKAEKWLLKSAKQNYE
ncbi:MAG: hypothetical protein LBG16_04740 [Elusimicrobiota bacterium]|jgi:TPR repeat protein|nr:hypothetical protein [Elusimicrobiota bacterium]